MFSTSEKNIQGVFTSTMYYAIKQSIGPLIGTIFISSFVGLLWIFFLCNFIKPFMWFTFLSVPVISFVIFLWMLFNGIFGIDNTLIAANQSKLLSIIPLIITGGHCLFIHRYHALINHCIDIIKVSCIILRQSLDIFGVSLFCLSIQILFSSFWLILFDRLFLLGSSTTIEGKANWAQDANLIYLVPFYLFYYWWTTCIIDGVERSSIAGTVSHWYFHQEETQFINGFNATHISFRRALTTSFGSICFGGLIASVVRFIQFLRQLNDQIPQSVNFLTTILRWVMWPIVLVSDLVEK
ncbi:hypothetical protein CONCODRAFT_97453 [Conidiobolus coronatus NRRL 28638]|uniref:Protein PNS1 n=1 Tax=Conidiobolus coronatus (strain ATCC 28846 / CBS 209.66 / NRRL 28638) TaxID=796925 RepID=A0A137P308_CONC2|nr:hypothetical protein CONCODRAFT_97453 [Conidiobolus coronatus NRRL 28638]|eukprot:KXN69284.1 hypothetical protein CONCODRAFT_97453 [Conidiobolus coronatus NRRL 28638]